MGFFGVLVYTNLFKVDCEASYPNLLVHDCILTTVCSRWSPSLFLNEVDRTHDPSAYETNALPQSHLCSTPVLRYIVLIAAIMS